MKSAFPKKIYVIGGHITNFIGKGSPNYIDKKHPLFGKKDNPTIKEYIVNTIRESFKEAKYDPKSLPIDNVFVGNFAAETFVQQGHLGTGVAEAHPSLLYTPSLRCESACASGAVSFYSGVKTILAGADSVLIVGAEIQNSVSAREGGDLLARAADYKRERKIDDFTFPALFARRKLQYMKKYGKKTEEQLYKNIVLPAYAGGNKNPKAHMHTSKLNLDKVYKSPKFLSNKELAEYLRVAECSQVTDGAAACFIVSEKGLKKLGKKPSDAIELLTCECSAGNLWKDDVDQTVMWTSKASGEKAYKSTGLKGKDIEVAELHDCFAIAQALQNECLGFAKIGEGTLPIKTQVNLGGGLMSFGHPTGATGIKQINEIFNQMKGKCGKYQMKKIPQIGLCSNMGGNDKSSVVSIFKNH